MKDFLNYFGAVVAMATIGLLLMSVCHELGYFYVVGSQYQSLLTTTDYFANAVGWLPLGAITIYGWIDWNKLTAEPKERDWAKWKTWVGPSLYVAFVLSMILITTWPPNAFTMYFFLLVFVVVWSTAGRFIFPIIETAPSEISGILRQAIRFVPPVMLGMFVYGWSDGSSDTSSLRSPYIIMLKGHDTAVLRPILRNFDKGVLVYDPLSRQVSFIKWDEVVSISKGIPGPPSRSVFCWVLGSLCKSYANGPNP